MTYDIYKNPVEPDKYFEEWDHTQLDKVGKALKEEIYAKYLEKCKTFQRDNFTCQNATCNHKNKELTIHHIKAKRNGGKDKARNLVTLCDVCHKKFEKGSMALTFADNADNLPAHIKGHTFILHSEEKINWKVIKARSKELRKELKHSGFNFKQADMRMIVLLLRFLERPYDKL